jgi:hypothetical protein
MTEDDANATLLKSLESLAVLVVFVLSYALDTLHSGFISMCTFAALLGESLQRTSFSWPRGIAVVRWSTPSLSEGVRSMRASLDPVVTHYYDRMIFPMGFAMPSIFLSPCMILRLEAHDCRIRP